jgi:hypothetical protein
MTVMMLLGAAEIGNWRSCFGAGLLARLGTAAMFLCFGMACSMT